VVSPQNLPPTDTAHVRRCELIKALQKAAGEELAEKAKQEVKRIG